MKKAKIKKLKHVRHKRAWSNKHKMLEQVEQEPKAAAMWHMLNMIAKEDFWQMPFVERKQLTTHPEIQLDDALNEIRNSTAPVSINWSKHEDESNRDRLAPLANKYQPVYWQALVSNLAIRKDKHDHLQGYLLLDKVVQIDPASSEFYLAFTRNNYKGFMDYHMWLPISRIKYFGPSKYQEIAQGECIRGVSYIQPYQSKGRTSYGLGTTIITDCGVIIADEHVRETGGNWKALNGKLISDYDRKNDWLAKLYYPCAYEMKLNRYRKKGLSSLSHLKGSVRAEYQLDKQVGYDDRFGFDAMSNLDPNDMFHD